MKNVHVALVVMVVTVSAGCASSQRTGTTPASAAQNSDIVVLESSATLQEVIQFDGRDIVLPVGWTALVVTDDEIVVGDGARGRISVLRVKNAENAMNALTEMAARSGTPLYCPSAGLCSAVGPTETTVFSDEAVRIRPRAWSVRNLIITARGPERSSGETELAAARLRQSLQ